MKIRDRIKEFRRVRAAELRPNPRNWRTHPDAQRTALQGILAEIGYAGALLARELPDGSLELIDGHLRAETTPDMAVPVLVLDVSQEEANKILATHDPLASLAGIDGVMLDQLLADVETDNPALKALMDDLATHADSLDSQSGESIPREVEVPALYQVVVECADESHQRSLYERLMNEGLKCRVLTL